MMREKGNFQPLISVVMPVYNGSKYVKYAIESVLAQTYKNFEIVLVNDGSTDNTEEIVKGYGEKIRYFKKENGGVSTALNLAIEKAKGDYISWLSHDDLYSKDKLEKQVNLLRTLDSENRFETILYSDYIVINENSGKLGETNFKFIHPLEKLNSPYYPLFNGLIHGCTLLIPKKCFDEIGKFNPQLRTTQDYDLWYRMFPEYKLMYLPDHLVRSRLHEQQGSKLIIATKEADNLWINMMESISRDQINFMSGGLFSFYTNTLRIVTDAKYTGAIEYIQKKLAKFQERDPETIKITVIIPFHNRVNWTMEAIESVFNQTHTNWELIIINDGSTEDVTKIIKLAQSNEKVKLITNNSKQGAAISRNKAIEKATGEYITFLDSDDLFMPDKLRLQLKFMIKENLMVSHTSYSVFGEDKEDEKIMDSGSIDYKFPEIIQNCLIANPTVMLYKDVFIEKSHRYPEKMHPGEDVCLWIRLSKSYEIKGYPLVLTKVRKHLTQASTNAHIQIVGLANIVRYCIDNFMDARSYQYIMNLNNSLSFQIYLIHNPQTDQDNVNVSGQVSVKQRIKRLMKRALLIWPTYRKIETLENNINANSLTIQKKLEILSKKQAVYEDKLDDLDLHIKSKI